MDNYVKLYQRILDSSIWKQPSDVRIVWITMLALKDEDGCVYGSVGWLADRARVEDGICEKALRIFSEPDARSRTVTHDGRKIEAISGGWRILNHLLYRDGIEDQREKWRRQKASQRLKVKSGESIRGAIKRAVDNDPITKADREAVYGKGYGAARRLPVELEYDMEPRAELTPLQQEMLARAKADGDEATVRMLEGKGTGVAGGEVP